MIKYGIHKLFIKTCACYSYVFKQSYVPGIMSFVSVPLSQNAPLFRVFI